MKKAIILGSRGQDGRLLAEKLLGKGYQILGISRNDPIDICAWNQVVTLVDEVKPNEIYHLAAHHGPSEDTKPMDVCSFTLSYETHVLSLLHFLEAIRLKSPRTKIFYAASSLVFGDSPTFVQTESTPLNPQSEYAITKTSGLLLCRYYRQHFSIFASTGILYNHESPHRKTGFLSKKITQAVVQINEGRQDRLVLGSLNSIIDWGYAPDFVVAMMKILAIEAPKEFIISTGIKHTVKDFVEIAFDHVGLDWSDYVDEDRRIVPSKPVVRIGNSKALRKETHWGPTVTFDQMVRLLVDAEKHG